MRIQINHIFPQYTDVTTRVSKDKELMCRWIKVGFTAFIKDDNQFEGTYYLQYTGNMDLTQLETEILEEIKSSL